MSLFALLTRGFLYNQSHHLSLVFMSFNEEHLFCKDQNGFWRMWPKHIFVSVVLSYVTGLFVQRIIDKQRVLMHGHQGWNVRHGLCHIYMIYVYIWVVYSFCLFCCLFIIVTTQFVALYKPCKPKPKPSTYDPPGQPPPGRDPKTDT